MRHSGPMAKNGLRVAEWEISLEIIARMQVAGFFELTVGKDMNIEELLVFTPQRLT